MAARKAPSHTRQVDAAARAPLSVDYARPWMFAFLVAFAHGGNISTAAKVAKVARRTVYLARETDPVFAAGWEDALAEAQDRIRAEVDRRAIEGWEEPVFGRVGKDRDGQIGTIRKFDGSLLAKLAAAHCPEFRKDGAPEVNVNVAVQITPEKLRQVQDRVRAARMRETNGRN